MLFAGSKRLMKCALAARLFRRESKLPEPFRSEVLATLWRLSSNSRLQQSSVSIAGNEVIHRGEFQLRYMFNDIFLEACYFFRADTDRPLILDCGSNIGMSILFFKKLYQAHELSDSSQTR